MTGCSNLTSLLKWVEDGFSMHAIWDMLEHKAVNLRFQIGEQANMVSVLPNTMGGLNVKLVACVFAVRRIK